MKLKYMCTTFMLLALAVMVWSPQVKAQINGHYYTVQWEDNNQNVIVNALYDAVTGDTATDGSRLDPDRIYVLLKGGVYQNTEHIQNNGYALRIMGQTPDPADQYGFPPIIQLVTRADGSADSHILLAYGDVSMKNVYIIGSDEKGVQANYYQPIEFESNGARCVFDSVIFERSNFAITAWQGAKNDEIFFTNCKWYNLVERPITQQWTGRAISIWADQDSVVVENCTVDNVGFTVLQIEGGAANYIRFNHNTIINMGRGLTSAPWLREAYFGNNLLINPFFDGEGYVDYNPVGNPSRYNYFTGIFGFSSLPASYGLDAGRRIVFANTAAFLGQTFKTAWDDTVRIQPYASATTDSFFTYYSPSDPSHPGQMVIQDTMWLNNYPNFTKFDTSNYPNMVQFIKDIRAGITPAPQWMQGLVVSGTDTIWTAPQWPAAQDFSYTDANLMAAGTDGLPLGDLNWFPDKHAQFEANKAADVESLQKLAGGVVNYPVDTTIEAEAGTVGGSAEIKAAEGFAYYRFETAGDIHWTFNVPSAVTNCKLVVYTDLTGSNPRGENIYLNGTNLQNNSGYGEYHFTSPPLVLSGWDSVIIIKDSLVAGGTALDLPAGANTLEIKKSWGYQNFSGFSIYDASGNLITKQTIQEADLLSGGIPSLEGSPWAPQGYKYDSLGTSGDVSWDLNCPLDGQYLIRVFYQNYGTDQTGNISVDGTQMGTVSLAANTDSTELSNVSDLMSLSAGTHTFKLSGSMVNVDYIQLLHRVVSAVKKSSNIPRGFALEQNYPNPFNPSTMINFSLAKTSNVKLIVYDILGQKVATLINSQMMSPGLHSVQFDARNLASGVYFYRIETGDFSMVKKMMLLK